MITLILIAQLLSDHPRHRAVNAADVVVVDVTQPAPLRSHEPASLTIPLNEPVASLPSHSPAIERAPWYVYGLIGLVGMLLFAAAYLFFSRTKKSSHETKIPLPDEDVELYGEVIHPPKTTQEYFAYVGTEEKEVKLTRVLPKDAPPRTLDECKAIYIEGIEALVQQMVWPAKLRCLRIEDAPVEIQWRAWVGDSWDREPLLRATGKEKGQALKSLLRKYKENGGPWISHAIERSSKTAG